MIKSPLTFQQKDSGMMARVMQGIAEMAALHKAFLAKVDKVEPQLSQLKEVHDRVMLAHSNIEERIADQRGPKGDNIKGDKGEPGISPKVDYQFLLNQVMDKLGVLDYKIRSDERRVADRIVATLKKQGLKPSDIIGLEETIGAFSRQLSTKTGGYIHGGGDTVSAGSGVSIAVVNGTKVISASGSSGTAVYNEVVAGSANTFTLAFTPTVGTVRVYGIGQRLLPTTDYTISGAVITTISSWSASQITADYSH